MCSVSGVYARVRCVWCVCACAVCLLCVPVCDSTPVAKAFCSVAIVCHAPQAARPEQPPCELQAFQTAPLRGFQAILSSNSLRALQARPRLRRSTQVCMNEYTSIKSLASHHCRCPPQPPSTYVSHHCGCAFTPPPPLRPSSTPSHLHLSSTHPPPPPTPQSLPPLHRPRTAPTPSLAAASLSLRAGLSTQRHNCRLALPRA